jgi:putative PEP-CTERM system integral membrane protein
MVHLGGTLAPAYDDATLETIQRRGGGAVTGAVEALTKLASASSGETDLGWADGYRFHLGGDDDDSADPGALGQAFAPLAVRRYVPGAARAPGAGGLDAVHKLAQRYAVVTPYSSMIVLVDDAQRAALRAAEAREDRFDRTVETGEARLSPPSSALSGVTGAPEPEEWVLLALTALGLAGEARRRLRGAALAPSPS